MFGIRKSLKYLVKKGLGYSNPQQKSGRITFNSSYHGNAMSDNKELREESE